MRKIFAGFDCGGSKTRCMLVSEDGNVLGLGQGGSSNYTFCGKDLARKSIEDSIRLAFADAKIEPQPIAGIFIASATFNVFGSAEGEDFFREITGCQEVESGGDIFPVWYAGVRCEPAIGMIAGTGAVVFCMNMKEKTCFQTSGWGPQFGDEGGGFDIGIHAVRYAARMADGRMNMDDEFYQAVLRHFEVPLNDPDRLKAALNEGYFYSRAASVTAVVMQLCENGNPVAKELVDYASEELALAVKALLGRTHGAHFPLLLSGGLLQNETPLQKLVIEKVRGLDQISSIQIPKIMPVRAAAAIALLHSGREAAAELLMQLE